MGGVITKGARCVGEIKSRITIKKKAVFVMTKNPLTNKLDLYKYGVKIHKSKHK